MLSGKNILLGVTGSIAVYKSAFLVRQLIKSGAQVKVIMTPAAKEFITPLTLSTLSQNPVFSEFSVSNTGEWNNHVELALWADLILIAPATADTIAKMATGICDNLLLATYLSAKCNVYVAPAMDLDMFKHATTQVNLKKLASFGNTIILPENGELASGLIGEGRMAEPDNIVEFLSAQLKKKAPLIGKKALVTAGPTYEAIDPVRFIGNNSSGKMGFALAAELSKQGADVILVCGPNNLRSNSSSIKRIDVVSSDEMHAQCMKYAKDSDITIMTAAVSDFKPAKKQAEKIKKEKGLNEISLVATKDILSELGKNKNRSLLVGFALETDNELANAKKKLHNKNLDFIVLNSLRDQNSAFGHDTNKITIIDKKETKKFELMSKDLCAVEIVKEVIRKVKRK